MYVCESDWFTQYGPVKDWIANRHRIPPTKPACVHYWVELLSPAISAGTWFDWRWRHKAFKSPGFRTFQLRSHSIIASQWTGIQLAFTVRVVQRWWDSGFLPADPILFLKNDIRIQSESCFGWNHTIRIRKCIAMHNIYFCAVSMFPHEAK